MKKSLFVILLLILAVVGSRDAMIQRQSNSILLHEQTVPPREVQEKKPAPLKDIVLELPKTGIVPARLYIPSLDVHADIEIVHVLENGQMGVPVNTDKVGYLSNGVLPGAVGNAVMDGHVDSYIGPAVFYPLKELTRGDVVIVKNAKGKVVEFVVESVETYQTDTAPIVKIFGPTREARLNLITCTGKYSKKKKEHLERLVVFTKRIG